jgi:hypothetical protein
MKQNQSKNVLSSQSASFVYPLFASRAGVLARPLISDPLIPCQRLEPGNLIGDRLRFLLIIPFSPYSSRLQAHSRYALLPFARRFWAHLAESPRLTNASRNALVHSPRLRAATLCQSRESIQIVYGLHTNSACDRPDHKRNSLIL